MEKVLLTLSPEQKEEFVNRYYDLIAKKANTDIIRRVVGTFNKDGAEYATCPFCDDRFNSFSINEDAKTFKCSNCGREGDVIEFVREHEFSLWFESCITVAKESGFDIYSMIKEMIGKDKILGRTDLCVRSGYSVSRGIGTIEEVVKTAKAKGIRVLGLCDDYSTSGHKEFIKVCKENDVLPIVGATLNVDGYRVAVLAKNRDGVASINKLISISSPSGGVGKYKNTLKQLLDNKENLITIGIPDKNMDEDYEYLRNNCDYIGIHNEYMATIFKLRWGGYKKVIAISDSYYCDPSDKLLFDSLCNEFNREGKHIKNTNELLNWCRFSWVFDNPIAIAFQISRIEYEDFDFAGFPYELDEDDFYDNVMKLASIKLPNMSQEVKERLERETMGVIQSKYASSFDLWAKITSFISSKGENYYIRGMGNNSLLAYVLGITQINPVEWQLPYEPFLGWSFEKMPDFDISISPSIKKDVENYVCELLGKNNVVRAGYVEKYNDSDAISIVDKYMNGPNFESKYGDKSDIKIFRLHNTAVNYGIHPGGLIIKPNTASFYEYTPIKKCISNDNIPSTLVDFHEFNDCLIKLDILQSNELSLVATLEKKTNTKFGDIPYEDKEVMEYINNKTGYLNAFEGINEFSTDWAAMIIRRTKPKTIEDYIKVSGLCHGTGVWSGNVEKLFNQGLTLDDAFANREDIYNILRNKCGIDRMIAFGVMDDCRKGRGIRREYRMELLQNNVPEYLINSMGACKYLFPRGHSIAYTLLSFKLMYYKVHYPKEFYESYLSVYLSLDKKAELLRMTDEQLLNVIISNIDSDWLFTEEAQIRKAARVILEARERNIYENSN